MDPAAEPDRPATAAASAPVRLLVPLLALGTLAAQLVAREWDDSRLTSFRWVFAGRHPLPLFALCAAALAVASLAAVLAGRSRLVARRHGAVLFVGSFAAAACFWAAPEPIVDAARYFTEAKHLELYGARWFLSEWGREIPAWTDLPLVPGLFGLAFRLFGESRLLVEALTTLLFSGAVVLTWRTGRALWDDEVGLAGAALLLAMPYLMTQVPSLLVDVPTMFFVALATFATVEAVRRGGAPRIALASAAVFLALLAKYSGWIFLSGLPALALVERERRGAWRRGVLVALGAALLAAAALLLGRDVFSRQLALLVGYQAPGLRRWGESLHSMFLFQLHPIVAAGALLSLWTAVRRSDARWLVAAAPVVLLVALDVRRLRYWLPAFPFLALLAARGLEAIRLPEARRLAVACAVASSLVVAGFGHLPFLLRTSAVNLKDAGAYLDSLPEPAALVLTPERPGAAVNPAVSVPILDLFTAKRLWHREEAHPEREPPSPVSPLRFTWEYRTPRYYRGGDAAGAAVVVISPDLDAPLPPDLGRFRLDRTFAADEGVFEHRTLVRVYRAP